MVFEHCLLRRKKKLNEYWLLFPPHTNIKLNCPNINSRERPTIIILLLTLDQYDVQVLEACENDVYDSYVNVKGR